MNQTIRMTRMSQYNGSNPHLLSKVHRAGFKWTFLILSLFNWLERSSSYGDQQRTIVCRPPISASGEDDGVESKEVLASNGQEGLKGDVNWQRMWTVSPCNCFEARRSARRLYTHYCARELPQLGDCGDGEYLRRTLAEEFQQMEPRVQI
ncbi:uncharacterized protein LOC104428498 isoform X2 [Eucalyptus grandis]|uniref:uncharacterized protein LOC104428498 isoform X2 n=1 Tax=Eucalyptus grandis TaxID=71139 RepID=UPI00192EB647|nr:uncharacterized protein LOC104428498 isoform X2 [Eucalyptus grandis]